MPLQILLNVKPPRVGVRVRALLRLALMQWLLLEAVSIGPGKDYWGDATSIALTGCVYLVYSLLRDCLLCREAGGSGLSNKLETLGMGMDV